MGDDVSDISEYYSSETESEQSRLERHQLERDLTWRYLDFYLPAEGSILEIGAATGGYTVELARRGYQITAVDMTAAMLEINRQTLIDEGLQGSVHLVLADARDLSPVSGRSFDVALLMGPLYHLIDEDDRSLAIRQAYERLRPGGLIFSAFISRFGILGDLLKLHPDWTEDTRRSQALLATGKRPEGYPPGGFRGYFATTAEIAPLHEAVGFETLTLAGVEPAISADDESYNRLEGEQRRLWLDLLFKISTEPSILGMSRHLLYIGRKPDPRQ